MWGTGCLRAPRGHTAKLPGPLCGPFFCASTALSIFVVMEGAHQKKGRLLSRPVASARYSITPSHSAHGSIVALNRDGPTATISSSFVSVIAVISVVSISVVPLRIRRSTRIDSDATWPYVDTLSEGRRRRGDNHCANEPQCSQCSRDQHGCLLFPCFVSE